MQAKLLHDRQRCDVSKCIGNKSAPKLLLKRAGSYPDTEGTVIVIKVQISSSLSYKRHILLDSITKHIVGVMKEVIE